MYPVSQSVINQYIAGGAESVSLTITPVNASPITISNSNLKSFKLDRYCCSGSTFDIGTAIASEIDFVLENTNGTYNNVTFEGAEVYATTQLRGGTVIPLGYFTIDNSPRKLSTISLTALDRMVMLDKYASGITYPTTIATLINTICTRCGVTLGTQVTNTYQVKAPTSSDITYRQLLQWACQLLGCNAYFDWAGQLKIETYSTSSALSLSRNVRYTSDIYENAITITGVQYVDGNNTYLDGTDDYVLDISGNELVNDPTTAVAQIFGVVGDFTYYPYNCTTKSFPFLYPMDCVTLVTNNGTTVATIITNIEYILNKNSIIKAVGTTEVEKGYATLNPLTSTEMKIIENVSQQTAQAEVTTRTAFIIDQNKTIANSLGLYVIEQITQSGTIYYYCDAPTLAASTIIYTFGSNGFAWTDDWNGGNPTWYYSFTRDGNAVMNMLSAYKVTADQLNVTGAITFTDLDTSTQNTITTASSTASSAASAASAAQGTADGIANNIYYTGTTYIDGTKIYTNSITANQIDATNLQVSAANITGTLTASQIDATNLQVSAANITGTLVASQIDATNLHVSAANIDGTITASQIAVGVIPTQVSDLTNDSGYIVPSDLGSSGTTTIDGGRITTGTISAARLNLTGEISFSDLDSSTQTRITTAESDASSAVSTAGNAVTTANAASGTATTAQNTADGIKNNIYVTNTTWINGDKIYTNSITADKINATNLHVSAANIDGTVTAGALAVSGGSGESGSITGNSSGLHIDTTSTTSCSIGLGYSGDMSLAAPDGSIDLDGQSINITSNLGDVTISSTSGSVVINSASFNGTFMGEFAGNMEGTLVASDYGTVLPAVSSQAPGTVFFLLV